MTNAKDESEHKLEAFEVFVKSLSNEVNKEDVYKMIEVQTHMLSRFEKTNEMLLNFNGLSNARYETTQKEFKNHIQLLINTKKDLDAIFRRIRLLKNKLSRLYPDAFKVCQQTHHVPDDETEEETMKSEVSETESSSARNIRVEIEHHDIPTSDAEVMTISDISLDTIPEIPNQ